jgi:hypothetical protein
LHTFFTSFLNKPLALPQVHWSPHEQLIDLTSQLSAEIERFLLAKESHRDAVLGQRKIVNAAMEFEEVNGRHGIRELHGTLRWNHHGFKVKYDKKKQTKIAGYYLQNLVIEKENYKPNLAISIETKQIREFWDKLYTELMI